MSRRVGISQCFGKVQVSIYRDVVLQFQKALHVCMSAYCISRSCRVAESSVLTRYKTSCGITSTATQELRGKQVLPSTCITKDKEVLRIINQ